MNERVPLSFLLTQNAGEDPPVEPVVPFAAMFGDDVKIVTAVLQRTAVLSEPSDRYDRKSVRHDQVLVDPAVITWRARTSNYEGHRILNDRMKPGSDEAKGSMHLLRQPRKPASHWRRSAPINPGNVAGAAARAASDERALTSQRDVEATKQRELAAHRQQTQHRIEEEAMSVFERQNISAVSNGVSAVEGKLCKRCQTVKPRDQFPSASGIYGGYCDTCTPLEKADRAAGKELKGTLKLKVGKPTGKPRRGKKIKLGETPLLVAHGPHDKVVKLLERRDSLRSQLAAVQAQLAEAIAG